MCVAIERGCEDCGEIEKGCVWREREVEIECVQNQIIEMCLCVEIERV